MTARRKAPRSKLPDVRFVRTAVVEAIANECRWCLKADTGGEDGKSWLSGLGRSRYRGNVGFGGGGQQTAVFVRLPYPTPDQSLSYVKNPRQNHCSFGRFLPQ